MFGIMQQLHVKTFATADEAIANGHVYDRSEYAPIAIKEVIIVDQGTVGGNPTVDLVLQDEHGNKFVTMVTGRLLKSLPL